MTTSQRRRSAVQLARIEEAARHTTDLAARMGAYGITSDPILSLAELLALDIDARKATWLTLDRSTKVAIALERLTERDIFFDVSDVDAFVAGLDAKAQAAAVEAAARAMAEAELVEAEAEQPTVATTETIIIDQVELSYALITVRASTSVAMSENQSGSYLYYAILVDGTYHNLVRVAHAECNPAVVQAFNAALSRVEAAVARLAGGSGELDAETPLDERSIDLAPGAHELDDGDVQAAYTAALAHPEMQTGRWQNALRKAFDHLREDRFTVSIGASGAYVWHPDHDEGGLYAVTPGHCTCTAFRKEQPCRHVALARVLSLLPKAEQRGVGAEIETLYRMVMWDVERIAA